MCHVDAFWQNDLNFLLVLSEVPKRPMFGISAEFWSITMVSFPPHCASIFTHVTSTSHNRCNGWFEEDMMVVRRNILSSFWVLVSDVCDVRCGIRGRRQYSWKWCDV